MRSLIILTLVFLFSLTTSAANDYDFSTIGNALYTYLKRDTANTQTESNSSLINYLQLSNYAVNDIVKTQGWKIDKITDYDGYGRETRPTYSYFQTDVQGSTVYIPTSAYYFIAKNNPKNHDEEGHLVVALRAGGIAIYSHNSDENMIKEFFDEFKKYKVEKNIYDRGVLEIVYDSTVRQYVFSFMQNIKDLEGTWDDLILNPELKKLSYELTEGYLLRVPQHMASNSKTKKGVLLAGPPGTGKSFLAQILASSIMKGTLKGKATMVIVTARHLSDISAVKLIYSGARDLSPTVVFMEDIDLLGIKNRDNQAGDFDSESRLNEMLNGIDGLIDSNYVLTIGTTNRVDYVDYALSRSLRLGQHIYFGLPEFEERQEFFNRFGKKGVVWAPDVTDSWLAARTENLTGSDIIEIIRFAKRNAYLAKSWKDSQLFLTQDYFNGAVALLKDDHKADDGGGKASTPKAKDYGDAIHLLKKTEGMFLQLH